MKRAAVVAAAADVEFRTVGDATKLLGETCSQIRRGEMDCKVGNALFYGASVALRALMPDEVGRQIEALRKEIAELQKWRAGHGNADTAEGALRTPPANGTDEGGVAGGRR